MERYTVVCSCLGRSATLAVPYAPSSLVSAFVEEVARRVARQGMEVTLTTHTVDLRLEDAYTGPIVDHDDTLDSVINPKTDRLFAFFRANSSATNTGSSAVTQSNGPPNTRDEQLSFRVITPELAKEAKATIKPISIAKSATIKQLHEQVANHLNLPHTFEDCGVENECNCNLAKQLADGPCSPGHVFVVHGKSNIQKLMLPASSNESAVNNILKTNFGNDILSIKKVQYHGAEFHAQAVSAGSNTGSYKKPPIVAICAKRRHIPVQAKAVYDEDGQARHQLDLHTSELPISRAAMSFTLAEARLEQLAVEGIIDIYAVNRYSKSSASLATPGHGLQAIYRYQAHWEPAVLQSDRGLAMYLSSLRCFASLVQDFKDDEKRRDAVFHAFDLLTAFPPALRTLYTLVAGKTPTAVECAALSHALFEVLDDFMPVEVIGNTRGRLFEGSRLLFGFILEKARTLKLPMDTADATLFPYLSAFDQIDLRDHHTKEPVMRAIAVGGGLTEAPLFEALQQGGLLFGSHVHSNLAELDTQPATIRAALLSGGSTADLTVFQARRLARNYCYPDAGNVNAAFNPDELAELHHVAELCGRNQLTVHKPSQLVSAVAPCLTWDRIGSLAVYTGQLPCSEPGKSSEIFRPKHGVETVDEAVLEQLIAPILQQYESEGSIVFDGLGGAAVRRLQSPDEILMFAVDCSASMRQPTDFEEVNAFDGFTFDDERNIQNIVSPEYYSRTNFDEMKELLVKRESFDDMWCMVAEASESRRRYVAKEVLNILRITLSRSIVEQHKRLGTMSGSATHYYNHRLRADLVNSLDKLKAFYAGTKTHEDALCDFLIFRAATSADVAKDWTWSVGDEVPTESPSRHLPSLPEDITSVPDQLVCPISRGLMEDAVNASDGFTYSRQAITQWFRIRSSSPMHGLAVQSTTLSANDRVSAKVADWIKGTDVISPSAPNTEATTNANTLKLVFVSRLDRFERTVPNTMKISDLYKVAYRGLKAKFMIFQLARDGETMSPSTGTISSCGLKDNDEISVRLADSENLVVASSGRASSSMSGEMCLVKVYDSSRTTECSYWVKRHTSDTVESILWKYWRSRFSGNRMPAVIDRVVWTDMNDDGDDLLSGSRRQSTDLLARYLNREHCRGHLGEEPVFAETGLHAAVTPYRYGQPLVLKVWIGTPGTDHPNRENPSLSRLDVLKQMFEALINRMLAYNYKTHVGLVTVQSTSRLAAPITHVLENLRRATTNMQAHGDTALWDALALCKDQLQDYGAKYPGAKKRIIVISDGEDTKSTSNSSSEIGWRMQQHNIAVDTVSLGYEDNPDLQTISRLLGCYRFHPESLVNALAICEMEPFLSVTERPEIAPPAGVPRNRLQFIGHFWNARWRTTPTVVTADRFPARKQHPNLGDTFIQLSAAAAMRPGNSSQGRSSRANFRISRVMREMQNILAGGGHPKADIYVSESDLTFWKICLDGPEHTPYAEGTFLLYLHMGERYPTFAPDGRFVTRIKHPNINAHGRICHSIFSRDWATDTSLTMVIDTVYGLLLQAETSDPVNTTATLGYHHDQVEYAEEVFEFVQKHAMKSRAEWKKTILAEDVEMEDEEDGEDDDDEDDEDDD